jgi:hypothetical protein
MPRDKAAEIRNLVSHIKDPKERTQRILYYATHPDEINVGFGRRFDGHRLKEPPILVSEEIVNGVKPKSPRLVPVAPRPTLTAWMKGLFL